MIRILKNKLINYSNELTIPLQELSILLSCSGGVDSMVLASLLLELRKEYGFSLNLMHFNHNAHVKAEICENFCRSFTINNNVKYYNRDTNTILSTPPEKETNIDSSCKGIVNSLQ